MQPSPPAWRTPALVIGCALLLLLGIGLFAQSRSEHVRSPVRSAIASATGVADPTPPAVPTTSPPAPRRGVAAAAVAAGEAAAHSGSKLGIAVFDRETGELAVGRLGGQAFYTASLSKLVVAVDVLDRQRLEQLAVTDADVELIRNALGPSDDDAMNALWSRFDGAHAAARLTARLGLEQTSDPDDPSQWGEMRMSPADMVKVLNYILELPGSERDVLVSAMDGAPAQAADGFDQMYGLEVPLPSGEGHPDVVAKQGWMCCFGPEFYLHSAGLAGGDRRFVLTLMSRIPRLPGWEAARRELDGVGVAVLGALEN